MLDTSHSQIGPCGWLGQSPFGDNFRHATTAVLSSGVDCGEKAGMGRGGVRWDRGETGGLSSKFWDSYNQSRSSFGCQRDWGYVFAHAPPLQEFGDMLKRSITNKIQSHGKRICACWCIAFVVCVGARFCVYLRISMRERIKHGLPTRVRSHLTAISHGPGILGSRSCNNDGNGLSQICFV